MGEGTIRTIYVCEKAGDTMSPLDEATVIKAVGIEGDRYATRSGTYSKKHAPDREVTLMAEEALAQLKAETGIDLAPEETRRNLITVGVDLHALIGKAFRVGDEVMLKGMRQCDPCGYLEELTGKKVFAPLKNTGGLRTTVVRGGTIRAGDAVEPVGEAEQEAVSAIPTSGGG